MLIPVGIGTLTTTRAAGVAGVVNTYSMLEGEREAILKTIIMSRGRLGADHTRIDSA